MICRIPRVPMMSGIYRRVTLNGGILAVSAACTATVATVSGVVGVKAAYDAKAESGDESQNRELLEMLHGRKT